MDDRQLQTDASERETVSMRLVRLVNEFLPLVEEVGTEDEVTALQAALKPLSAACALRRGHLVMMAKWTALLGETHSLRAPMLSVPRCVNVGWRADYHWAFDSADNAAMHLSVAARLTGATFNQCVKLGGSAFMRALADAPSGSHLACLRERACTPSVVDACAVRAPPTLVPLPASAPALSPHLLTGARRASALFECMGSSDLFLRWECHMDYAEEEPSEFRNASDTAQLCCCRMVLCHTEVVHSGSVVTLAEVRQHKGEQLATLAEILCDLGAESVVMGEFVRALTVLVPRNGTMRSREEYARMRAEGQLHCALVEGTGCQATAGELAFGLTKSCVSSSIARARRGTTSRG
jgi:hypothetical protein